MNAFYIISTATLLSISCGLLGCFLILRKMAMVGDAISHAILPGIVIAFLLTGSRNSFEMILGASTLGIFTTFLVQFLHKKAGLQNDAAIGVTFTGLFAIGIILISLFAGKIDLDQDCVLYGEIAYIPLDSWITESGANLGPKSLYIALTILAINIIFIILGYKELITTTFDAHFASAIGISVSLWNYLLMGMVSMTTVAAFESVGAILIVALLVVPAATAYLLSDQFKTMCIWVIIISVLNSSLGYLLAVLIDGSIAGAIVTVSGIIFGLAFLFSPKRRNSK